MLSTRRQSQSLTVAMIFVVGVVVIILQVRWINKNRDKFTDPGAAMFASMADQQTVRIHCDVCEGSGFQRDPGTAKLLVCGQCDGLGMHRVRFLDPHDVLCAQCMGMGRVSDERADDFRACVLCDGRGAFASDRQRFEIYVDQVVCSTCDGRGLVREQPEEDGLVMCSICFGLGSHLVRKLDTHEKLCVACGGMGRLQDTETGRNRGCELCRGRGAVVLPSQNREDQTLNKSSSALDVYPDTQSPSPK